MKNRAGLLALVVLAVAILLMVFVVMPQLGNQKPGGEQASTQANSEPAKTADATPAPAPAPAGEASKTSRPNAADAAAGNAGAVGEAVGRLMQNAGRSLDDLNGLMVDGKGPPEDAYQAAKANAITALDALAGYAVPQGADPASAAAATKAKDGAGKAAAIIRSLPENIADARTAIANARAALLGQPAVPAGSSSSAGSSAPAIGATAGNAAPAQSSAAAATPRANPEVPSFDVLRVEPDGSAVIAGSAKPNSQLEVLNGNSVVATAKVGPSGDFAVVLDNPLAPGDHQLILKSTGSDGKASVSDEIATVSIPRDRKKSELLAMVSKPGEASRIISAPTASGDSPASAPAVQADAAGSASPVATAPSDQVAAAGTGLAKSPLAQTTADVMVSAVEIEGSRIFVAGRAKPNAKVQAYADDSLIGGAVTGPDGHFVIEGALDLAVGDHKIRVDLLGADGKVAVRTTVNFTRPEGNQFTVAAQGAPATGQQAASLEQSSFDRLKSDAVKAFALLSGLFDNNKVPTAEQLAAARSGSEIALRSIVDFRPSVDASDAFKQTVAQGRKTANDALTLLSGLPSDPTAVGKAIARLSAIMTSLAPAPADDAAAGAGSNLATNNSGPMTIEQAPLTESKETVIIRRGDTLWQISRRIYGAGVRYTTIYVANEDKITNPDRILPGQIFGLPKDALPNAEELHRKRLTGEHL